ncbi:MAG: hypothetical protein QW828_08125, partial [Candidatus Bathyarchaeia archaeon]
LVADANWHTVTLPIPKIYQGVAVRYFMMLFDHDVREVVFNSSLPELTRIVTIATAGISLAACLSVWSQVFFTNVEHDLENDLSVPRTMYIPGLVAAAAIVVFGLCFTLNWMGLASFDPALTSALRIVAETTIRPEANS